jgi:hypothetical protein
MVQKTRDQQVLEEGSMASEAAIVQALDALTNPPSTRSLTRATTSHLGLMQGILNRRDVIGVGISEKISQGKPTGTLALSVYVVKKQPLRSLRGNQVIPPVLPLELSNDQAIPTDVLEVGQVRPQLAVKPMVIRKPVQPGYSIGHTSVTAGTLGAIVQSGTTLYILSNSHVLAQGGLASIGDAIVYPGPADGGNDPADIVARLSRFIPFIAGGTFVNTSDCAIAEILPERLAQVRADIKGLGFPNGTTKPTRGMEVTKVGRTTRKTAGKSPTFISDLLKNTLELAKPALSIKSSAHDTRAVAIRDRWCWTKPRAKPWACTLRVPIRLFRSRMPSVSSRPSTLCCKHLASAS